MTLVAIIAVVGLLSVPVLLWKFPDAHITHPHAIWWFYGVAGALLVITLATNGVQKSPRSGECYTDWDGRSNPIVCD